MSQATQPNQITAQIKRLASQVGFDVVGVTRPQALEEGERAIEAWVHEGRHGTMKYLEDFKERHRRFFSDMKQAQSVIVLGVNYYAPSSRENPTELSGRVARYAWGKDYHQVIRGKHDEL